MATRSGRTTPIREDEVSHERETRRGQVVTDAFQKLRDVREHLATVEAELAMAEDAPVGEEP